MSVKGTFDEDVAIVRPNVTIQSCNGAAMIRGVEPFQPAPDPERPSGSAAERCFPRGYERYKGKQRRAAVCIGAGAHHVRLQGLAIQGDGMGVDVVGATDVTLHTVRIHDTGSFGLRLMEAKTSSGRSSSAAALEWVSILRAHGAGIQVVGSKLEMSDSSIQHTRPLNSLPADVPAAQVEWIPKRHRLGWARALSIHPGVWPENAARARPQDFQPSDVDVVHSVLSGNEEMAVFASGASVDFDRVFFGGVSGGAASGRGIVAERSIPAAVDTVVNVRRSVIENTVDAAVDVRDARVLLENTTIRETRGREGDGCSGQAVRARSLSGAARAHVTVNASTLIGARQAGIFAAASTLELDGVLVRDVRPNGGEGACAEAMGDGVALETFSGQAPADAVLKRVRIDRAGRAALLTTGGSVELTSTLLGCSRTGMVEATGRGASGPVRGALCGCGSEWARCARAVEPLASWVSAGPSPVWPGTGAYFVSCIRDYDNFKQVAGLTYSDLVRPEIAPTAAGTNGCVFGNPGPNGELTTTMNWKEDYSAAISVPTVRSESVVVSGLLARTSLVAGLGHPLGPSLLNLQRFPGGARLVVNPGGLVLDVQGQPFPGDRLPSSSNDPYPYPLAYVATFEPGWHTLELVDLPAGVHCEPNPDVLGDVTRPNVRFVKADWGFFANVLFGPCAGSP